MIKKRENGYVVTSEGGKKLGGPYRSRETAVARLGQVEYFKHRGDRARAQTRARERSK